MKKLTKQAKSKLKPLVQKLLERCSNVKVLTRKAEWEEITEIYKLIGDIQNIEKNYKLALPNRALHWENLYAWCKDHGCDFNAIKVSEISEGNFGFIAERDIKEDESFISIPRNVMLTENSAMNSKLGPLISKDPVLQHMPNVQIAMHLIMELLDENSFWKPYLNILPSSYETVLYFSLPELHELQGSPVLDDVFKIIRSVARQYCYFFQLFQNDAYAKSLNIGFYFTYELYRWAVSTVMTRQNFVPCADGQEKITALIPVFDMCNHTNGKLSTDFFLEKDLLISYACKSFPAGAEVCMFYGTRTNGEFFVHNAFVYDENQNDAVEIKFGISKSDPLYSLKSDLCYKFKVALNGAFRLYKEEIVAEELLLFLKINVMKSEELQQVINEFEDNNSVLENFTDLKQRALLFLKDRVNLLLRSYKTTLEEDEKMLKSGVFESSHQQLAVKLRICEKRIFSVAYKFCSQRTS